MKSLKILREIKMNFKKYIGSVFLLASLMACGGGGGSAGGVAGGNGGNGSDSGSPSVPVPSSTVADFVFELNKSTILNAGGDAARLTVTALDANRNALSGVGVQVSLSPDGIFQKTTDVTDVSGKFSGDIGIGGSKSNRVINATIKVGSLSKVASVAVSGSQLAITPVPATPTPGQTVVLNISAADSAGGPLGSLPLILTGPAGTPVAATTDMSGNAVVSFVAPLQPGSFAVGVSGSGITASKIVEVIAAGSGGKPPAIGSVSSASLTPVPTSIKPNSFGSTTNRARLQAKFLGGGNVGIENMRVRFNIVGPALGGGEMISTGDAVVYSDTSGVAQADYISGIRSSPTNGVVVRACYSANDFVSPIDCPASVTATLTVAGDPLSISIGDNNELQKGLGNIAYIKQFLIQVNDASGVAVGDAIVSVSTDITHYGKGSFDGVYPRGVTPPTIADGSLARVIMTNPSTGATSSVVVTTSTVAPSVAVVGGSTTFSNIWCMNEDVNRNGSLDSVGNEDVNGDGVLQPRKAEIIVSYVNGNRTNADGQMLVQVSYSQNMGSWLAYTLRATTSVAGSEGDASKSYITDVLQADVANGSFLTPPFGVQSCSNRN